MKITRRNLNALIESYLLLEEEDNSVSSFKQYLKSIANQEEPTQPLLDNQKKLTQIGPAIKGRKYPKGSLIEFIQKIIGMSDADIDGVYGVDTAAAIKSFQNKKGIRPDFQKENELHNDIPGIIGFKTAQALLDSYDSSLEAKDSAYDDETEESFIDYIEKGKNEVHYRLTSTGRLYRFGVLKNGKWTMDDPALEYTGEQKNKIAQSLIDKEGFDSTVKKKLQKIIDNKSLRGAASNFGTGITTKIANSFMRMITKGLQSAGAPVHLIAFAYYLAGRTTTFTENDLNDQYKKDLAKCAQIAMATTKGGEPGRILCTNNFVYKQFWQKCSSELGQGKLNTPIDSPPGPIGSGTVEELMYFLGGMTVKDTGENYVITDIYDFDDYFGNASAFDEFGDFLDDLKKEDYKKIRAIASWRQSTGYSGFRVEITLPKTMTAIS